MSYHIILEDYCSVVIMYVVTNRNYQAEIPAHCTWPLLPSSQSTEHSHTLPGTPPSPACPRLEEGGGPEDSTNIRFWSLKDVMFWKTGLL